MKDPHVHAEKTTMPGFGQVAMADLFGRALGLGVDLPKTVGTGCGRRRQLADTSTIPEHVTCLGCREWAAQEHSTWADMADAAVDIARADPSLMGKAKVTPESLAAEAAKYRDLARRFGHTEELEP